MISKSLNWQKYHNLNLIAKVTSCQSNNLSGKGFICTHCTTVWLITTNKKTKMLPIWLTNKDSISGLSVRKHEWPWKLSKIFQFVHTQNEIYGVKINCQGLNSGFCLKTGIHVICIDKKIYVVLNNNGWTLFLPWYLPRRCLLCWVCAWPAGHCRSAEGRCPQTPRHSWPGSAQRSPPGKWPVL